MIGEIQREVAVHLLANALRKRRIADGRRGDGLAARRRTPEEEYLRGMLDLLRALHGQEVAAELYQLALALEQPEASTPG